MVNEIGPVDLVIICVKSNATAEAATLAEMLIKPDTTVLTLQNGMGNAEQLAESLGSERLLVGATLMGAIVLEPGLVTHSGLKNTHIAAWTAGNEHRVNLIREAFARAGLPTVNENNVNSLLWSKLSLHAGLNAVTALTQASNKEFLQLPEAIQLAKLAVAEVVAVATVAGIPLLYSNCAQEMLAYAEAMHDHQSPMLQDVLHKRKSEIEAINGSVIREGRKYGVPTPVNEALTLALRTIEMLY
jgi:2-dehydropantoate 2-reductase